MAMSVAFSILLFALGCYAYPVEVSKPLEGAGDVAKPAASPVFSVPEVKQPEQVKEEVKSPVAPVPVVEVAVPEKKPAGFQGYDLDGNGFLDAQEWARLLAAEEIKRDFAIADLNGDSLLSLEEYENAPWNVPALPPKDVANEVYIPVGQSEAVEILVPAAREEQPGLLPIAVDPVPFAVEPAAPLVPLPQDPVIAVKKDSVPVRQPEDLAQPAAPSVPEAFVVGSYEETKPAVLASEAKSAPEPVLPQIQEAPEVLKEILAPVLKPLVQEAPAPLLPQVQEALAPVLTPVQESVAPALPQVKEAQAPLLPVQEAAVPQVQESSAPALPLQVQDVPAPVLSQLQEAAAPAVLPQVPGALILKESVPSAQPSTQEGPLVKESVPAAQPVQAAAPQDAKLAAQEPAVASQSDPAVVVVEQAKVDVPAAISPLQDKPLEGVKSSSSEEVSKQEEVLPPKQSNPPVDSDVKDSDESKESDEESPSNIIRL